MASRYDEPLCRLRAGFVLRPLPHPGSISGVLEDAFMPMPEDIEQAIRETAAY